MKLLWGSLVVLLQIYLTSALGGHQVARTVQLCRVDAHETKIDACLALASSTNTTSRAKDLRLHISVNFPWGTGWAGFGVGDRMDSSLMFILYPGAGEDSMFYQNTYDFTGTLS